MLGLGVRILMEYLKSQQIMYILGNSMIETIS